MIQKISEISLDGKEFILPYEIEIQYNFDENGITIAYYDGIISEELLIIQKAIDNYQSIIDYIEDSGEVYLSGRIYITGINIDTKEKVVYLAIKIE